MKNFIPIILEKSSYSVYYFCVNFFAALLIRSNMTFITNDDSRVGHTVLGMSSVRYPPMKTDNCTKVLFLHL